MPEGLSEQEYIESAHNLIYILSCALNQKAPDPARIEAMNLRSLLITAKRHMLSALAGFALEKAGVQDRGFMQAKMKALRRYVLTEQDKQAVTHALEDAKIWYMPLKGSVLKEYYPSPELREMSDVDILVDASRIDDVRRIMHSLGFTGEIFSSSIDEDYHKDPFSEFEMHKTLFGDEHGENLMEYYSDVKSRLLQDRPDSFAYHFGNEDMYIYMTAHERKHYETYGTGLRAVTDTYIFLQRFSDSLDWGYVHGECGKLGISDFERRNRELAMKIFGGGELSASEREMLKYIILSGVHGVTENMIQNELKKYGKAKYFFYRIFIPMSAVKTRYPFFARHKVLLPILPVYRLVKRLYISRGQFFVKLREEARRLSH
ncbi:MAG: nucleotidyltransferase family protein [Synergistaceae bacterium]|nr:nucleotidyltransferase family protein [Synergistaceae bacterium]MBR0034570.1 nucleotidyltransferase family protein [Synergistaceae bacterium]